MNKTKSLIAFLVLVFVIATLGSYATQTSLDPWYRELPKPSWTPPSWVFGPVWTVLYIMIAIAGWMYYHATPSENRTRTLIFYSVQLVCNGLWSFFFFYFQNPSLGLKDLSLLTAALVFTLYYGWKVSRPATLLLVPYFIWTLYALSLNAEIVRKIGESQ